MTEEYVKWMTGTPEQVQRMNALATQWRQQAKDDPIVLLGAATTVLMNAVSLHVTAEHQEAVIESVYDALRQILPEEDSQ